jgi:crotonobetainyl-CoA:carnitine CoA-transferase CaiB-like acyl-CoA transferase
MSPSPWHRAASESPRNRAGAPVPAAIVDADGRHEHIDYLYSVIAGVLPERDSATWLEALSRLDIPCSRVNRLEDPLEAPHLRDVDFFHVGER